MPGWFKTAQKALRQRTAPPPPQRYSVSCECGETLAGVRTEASQTLVCPRCRALLFVLPASPYPVPRDRSPAPAVAPPSSAVAEPPPRQNGRGNGAAPRPVRAPPAPRTGPETAAPRRAGLRPLRRPAVTPLRAVLLVIVAVIAGTAWWLVHLRDLEQARTVIASTPRQAEEALQEDEIHEAARHYDRLRDAADRLGRQDPAAQGWRQLARETAALADLAAASPHEILGEAVDTASSPARDLWDGMFRGTYRDAWVVVDAPVVAADGPDGRAYRVDFPLAVGAVQARLVADLPAFARCVAPGGAWRRVIFAAQLEACRFDEGPDQSWRIELRPGTGFLWVNADTLERLGFTVDDDTRKILDEQARLTGVSE